MLHEKDIMWGDVHPGNVIIENDADRAVLIDFEGGAVRSGWVDLQLAGSKAGDLQGLSRLFSFIDKIRSDNDV